MKMQKQPLHIFLPLLGFMTTLVIVTQGQTMFMGKYPQRFQGYQQVGLLGTKKGQYPIAYANYIQQGYPLGVKNQRLPMPFQYGKGYIGYQQGMYKEQYYPVGMGLLGNIKGQYPKAYGNRIPMPYQYGKGYLG